MHKSGIIKITKPTRDNDKKYRYFKRKFKALMAGQGKEKTNKQTKQNKKTTTTAGEKENGNNLLKRKELLFFARFKTRKRRHP